MAKTTSGRKLQTYAGGISPISLCFFTIFAKNKAYLALEIDFVSNLKH